MKSEGSVDIREVFAGPFDNFLPQRNALAKAAKQAGDPESAKVIGGWRKPTRGAWLVNLLSRHEPEQVTEALALGESLAEAHRNADAAQLRELSQLRNQLVAGLARRAVDLARADDYEAPEAVRVEVSDTLTAGLADPEVAEAIRAGTLSRTVRAAGFGPVDLFAPLAPVIPLRPAPTDPEPEPATAAGVPDEAEGGPDPIRLTALAAELKRAEATHQEAEGRSARATAEAGRADAEQVAVAQNASEARRAVHEARRALARAERDLTAAEDAEREATSLAESARAKAKEHGESLADAESALARVREELARLLGLSSGPS